MSVQPERKRVGCWVTQSGFDRPEGLRDQARRETNANGRYGLLTRGFGDGGNQAARPSQRLAPEGTRAERVRGSEARVGDECMDKMLIIILPGGLVKVETGRISGPNHLSADRLLRGLG